MAVYNESIIDDQLERLDNMYHSGGLTKDQYEKQRANWEKRRSRYDYNVKREKEEAEIKARQEARKPKNRFKALMSEKINHTTTESVMDLWENF